MKFQVHLGFILLDNRIIIDFVTNRTYILTASKRRQIQVNYLLNLRYKFKYPMAVKMIKYNDILFYIFNAQAVNHLSPYAGVQITTSLEAHVEHLLLHSKPFFLQIQGVLLILTILKLL